MKRRSFFLAIAVGLLVSGIGALDARAGYVPLSTTAPFTTFDELLPTGNYTSVESLTFSNFGFSSSTVAASSVNVLPFTSIPGEAGLTFTGGLYAAAGTIVDVSIFYTVTAPAGLISDAYSSFTGGNFGGTGQISVAETLTNAATGGLIGTLESSLPGSPVSSLDFAGVESIRVEKDIILVGGSSGSTISIIDQGFSSTVVPEPTSMALLGIGMTGFLAFRRLFKRTSVA